MGETISRREEIHFDRLIETTGETWWGNKTAAGKQRFKRKAEKLLNFLNPRPLSLLLELGSGTGLFSREILDQKSDLNLIGVDISERALNIARNHCCEYSRITFIKCDILSLPFPNNYFDAIIGNSTLHHLPSLQIILEKIHSLLKPGGKIWFSEPNMLNPHVAIEKNIPRLRRWSQGSEQETAFFKFQIARYLRSAGFESIEVHPFDFLHPLVPKMAIPVVSQLGRVLESIPMVREFSGSLEITARKNLQGLIPQV